MVFSCCFGSGGGGVVVEGRSHGYGASANPAGTLGKAQDLTELASGAANRNGAAFLTGNTTSLSAVTNTDNSSATYQLNILNSALAGLPGNWYERVSSAASRLISASGAALCSVCILDGAHDRFTVVHVTGKKADCAGVSPEGSYLPALQAVAPSAHLSPVKGGVGLRYNSVQVLQLLQTPLLYSFSDPTRGSQETNQPPHDWQAIYDTHGLSDFCALPLVHDKSVVGAVTLIFSAPPSSARQQPQQQQQQQQGARGGLPGRLGPSAATASLMSCDEQSLRTVGLLLSVVLVGQDIQLAQQVADILAGVYDAKNLQQAVTVITAGAEQVLQLTTRVVVTTNLAMVIMPSGSPLHGLTVPATGTAAATAAGPGPPGTSGGPVSMSGMGGGRAIFFEEHCGGGGVGLRLDCSAQGGGANGSKSFPALGDARGSSSGLNGVVHGAGHRSRLQRSANTEASALSGQLPGQNGAPPRVRVLSGAAGQSGLRSSGQACMSQDSASAALGGSNVGMLLQTSMVQARALGLRHTLLANLPAAGTVVQDCASYMQQVGCPKRDLYLLSACQGAPPFSLVIVPAPLKEGDSTQLVLYVTVAMRLPYELLNEVLVQAQLLAVRVLAPLLQQKLLHGNLSNEWSLLLGCATGRGASLASGHDSRVLGSGIGNLATSGGGAIDTGGSLIAAGSGAVSGVADGGGGAAGGGAGSGAQRLRYPQLPAGLTEPVGSMPEAVLHLENARTGMGALSSELSCNGTTLPAGVGTQGGTPATVLSTAVGGAFVGDTRTHMGMLVSSFKDTINALQAMRADEAEELSVLKLGKVLGRGGSGLVFQGYLHMGLEVAVKLFENPDDTDPDAVSAEDTPAVAGSPRADGGGGLAAASAGPDAPSGEVSPTAAASNGGGGAAAAAKEAAPPPRGGAGGGTGTEKEKEQQGSTGGGAEVSKDGCSTAQQQPPARRNSLKSVAQMTKRQRDLLRNALELGVTSSLSHPNIVQGYCHWVNVVLMQDASLNRCWLMGQVEYMALAPPGSPPPPLCSALVMEYCDMGSLIHALKRGTFTSSDSKPNMEFVYMCLLEIALALRHLHTAKLAHCDLKPGNVLLRSSPRDPRSFVCKLGDFGYAAILKDGLLPGRPAVLPDEACGTLQYMAPELFVAGRPVDASIDIYAFGMLMWELITGKTPYSENEYGSRALMKAVYHGKRPVFPDSTLLAYKNLAMCCWSGDPNMRPSATVLVKLLRQQLESLKQQSGNNSSGSAAGSKA